MSLPYHDTKPQGAADFYFAINATFRFLEGRLGRAGWVRYLQDMGRGYFAPVNDAWRVGGLPAVAAYWRAFFEAEPGGEVEIHEREDEVEIEVRRCPAIAHLRVGGREIVPFYCTHCYHLGEARAAAAGLTMRLEGGAGSCRHRYFKPSAGEAPQRLEAIREVASC